jgi:hypothetical protein
MNSKSYIGYFSEIRDLEKSEQEELLELARYEAFTTLKLNGISALYFVISLLSLALTGCLAIPYWPTQLQ